MVNVDSLAAWPFPGDSPVVKARRVALAYRARLAEVDPEGCAVIDKRVERWGQGWAVVRLQTFELDQWISVKDAAELASVQVRQIAAWRRMGRLRGRRAGNTWEYLVRDVLSLSTTPRSRRKKA